MNTFFLPDLGEGLPDGEISEWHVKEGDMVKLDEPLVSIETAKAVVDVPSPFTGKVAKLYGKKGDIILTGAPLVDFEGLEKRASSTVAGEIKEGSEIYSEKPTILSGQKGNIKVLPAVRALAKKLNVDLLSVLPTGVEGTITAEDIKKASGEAEQTTSFEPLKGVRRAMAQTMAHSHSEVVPVNIVEDADITAWAKEKDFTVRVLQAIAKACHQEPSLNAWYNGKTVARSLLSSVNVGLAMDTQEGLFVPVITEVQNKSALQLRSEVEQLKQEIQARTVTPQKLQGASIVLSNFGKFAGRYATPVVVVPTVAILGVGSFREEVRPLEQKPCIRSILPLSLTFDHRAVTGGEATRFLQALILALESPEAN